MAKKKPKGRAKPPAKPPAPTEAVPVHQGELISRKVIRHHDGSVEVIEKFAVPLLRLPGPLRIIAADPEAGTVDLSDATRWRYDPAETAGGRWRLARADRSRQGRLL